MMTPAEREALYAEFLVLRDGHRVDQKPYFGNAMEIGTRLLAVCRELEAELQAVLETPAPRTVGIPGSHFYPPMCRHRYRHRREAAVNWTPKDERRLEKMERFMVPYTGTDHLDVWLTAKLREARQEIGRLEGDKLHAVSVAQLSQLAADTEHFRRRRDGAS